MQNSSSIFRGQLQVAVPGSKFYSAPLMARSYANQPMATTYNSLEKSKKAKYNERILNIEHGTFTPIVLSCFGGMGIEALRFYNRLGRQVAEKRDEPFSVR